MTTKEIWVCDAETDPFKAGRVPKPFVWGIYNGSEYHEFIDTDEMVDFLVEREAIVYAHNGGKFDWHFILHRLEQFEPLMVISGRLAKFKIGLCEFRDSYNILPFPLSAFQKDEIDYNIFEEEERNKRENWDKITKYLKSDCVYLYQVVTEFIERYGLHLTQAGAAVKVWEKLTNNKAPETTREFYQEIGQYYYGGRVQCFETGIIERDFIVVDINSAYPHAMKHAHPYGDQYHVTDELPNTKAFIERSFIRLKAVSRGAFPFREKTGLCFPDDDIEREYFITGWEFLAAIETRTLDSYEIISVTIFNDCIRFDDYIDHFYALKDDSKKKGDNAGYLFAKLFLNSLYGKFGANPDNYNEYTIVKPKYVYAAEDDGYEFAAELGDWALCQKPLEENKQRFYNVAVAASITGFVRAYMWRSLCQVTGRLYCDTDSIACESINNLDLDPHRLGAWDIEANCDYGGIAGKKLYAFHTKDGKWKTASKGVRLSPEQIMEVAKGKEITYEPENPSFSLKRGIKFISRKVKKIVD